MAVRTLLVLRHAEATQHDGWADVDRPLTHHGRRQAAWVGARLLGEGLPGHVLCSVARRTRQTLEGVEEGSGHELPTTWVDGLYLPSVASMFRAVADAPDVPRLLVVSHNPGCENLVRALTDNRVGFDTAALATLEGEGPAWADALDLPWRLVSVTPASVTAR